jgi:hypothetical protein
MHDTPRTRPEQTALVVNCAACERPITIVIPDGPHNGVGLNSTLPIADADDLPPARQSSWHCPWCEAVNTGELPGEHVFTFKGHRLTS